jgi:hypothetical protein
MKNDKTIYDSPIAESEAALKARLKEMESCEYFLDRTLRLLSGWVADDELLQAASIIKRKLIYEKCLAWERIAMLSAVSKPMQQLLRKKLEEAVNNEHTSLESFINKDWNCIGTDPTEFREYVKSSLKESLNLRSDNTSKVVVEVPDRKLTPDL